MKASHEDQLRLLELHKLDARATSLRHKRAKHPAHRRLEELKARAADLERALVAQGAVISDTKRELTKVEDDVEKVRARRSLQQGRIDDNKVPLRDVSAMLHEIERMDARLDELETAQLEVMERLENAEAAKEQILTSIAALGDDVEATKQEFVSEVTGLDEELGELGKRSRNMRGVLPEALLAEYDRAWKRNGALAVMELRGGRAIGGGLADLSPAELDELRNTPEDQLAYTDELQQIVVRTKGE